MVRTQSMKLARLIFAYALGLALVAASLIGGAPASADTGDILRTLNVNPVPDCGVTVGIAFDGEELLVSCIENQVLTRVNPADGTNLGSIAITGMGSEGIGAISWDAKNNQLWIGTYSSPMRVYKATLDKAVGIGTATLAFEHTLGGISLVDGLAYDGTDDTLWFSPDVSDTVYHYDQSGNLLGLFSISGKLGGCGNSGLVVADATTLYLGNNGCEQIYASQKDGSSTTLFAQLPGKRVEDLECDNTTFAPKSVIWSKDAYDYELNAFEVPAGQCAEGGVVEPLETDVPLDIHPTSCPNPLNVKRNGVLPAAILGTADFDVTQVDSSTISLAGVSPVRSAVEDVATPFEPLTGKQDAHDCTTAGPDGHADLTLKFDTQALAAALGPVNDQEVLVLELTGTLLDGTSIAGEDVVVIIKK